MKIDFAQKLDGNAFRVKLKRSSRISAQETNLRWNLQTPSAF
jgi:hypothetical protein